MVFQVLFGNASPLGISRSSIKSAFCTGRRRGNWRVHNHRNLYTYPNLAGLEGIRLENRLMACKKAVVPSVTNRFSAH